MMLSLFGILHRYLSFELLLLVRNHQWRFLDLEVRSFTLFMRGLCFQLVITFSLSYLLIFDLLRLVRCYVFLRGGAAAFRSRWYWFSIVVYCFLFGSWVSRIQRMHGLGNGVGRFSDEPFESLFLFCLEYRCAVYNVLAYVLLYTAIAWLVDWFSHRMQHQLHCIHSIFLHLSRFQKFNREINIWNTCSLSFETLTKALAVVGWPPRKWVWSKGTLAIFIYLNFLRVFGDFWTGCQDT